MLKCCTFPKLQICKLGTNGQTHKRTGGLLELLSQLKNKSEGSNNISDFGKPGFEFYVACIDPKILVIHVGSVYTIIKTYLIIKRETLISVVVFSDLLSLPNIPGSIAITILSPVAGGGAGVVGEPAGQGGDGKVPAMPVYHLPASTQWIPQRIIMAVTIIQEYIFFLRSFIF